VQGPGENDLVDEQRIDRVLFVGLHLAGLFGSLIGVPYTIAVLMDPAAGGTVDVRVVWLSAVVEATLFLAPASAVGVWLGKRVGLGPRLLRALVAGMPGGGKHLRSSLLAAVLVGLTLGLIGLWQYSLPEGALGPGLDNPTTFEHFLRALSAALTEEILFRLGLLTLFVWVIGTVAKRPVPDAPSQWAGNLLVAPIFFAAHLPHILAFGSIGRDFLLPIFAVSSTASIVMGWLYTRYGLISAMLAHFIVDLVANVIARLWI
jgi:hypothetical protein